MFSIHRHNNHKLSDQESCELIKSIVIIRHGSRGPTKSCINHFINCSSIISEWKEEELENLSEIGKKQMEILGNWFATEYLKKYNNFFTKNDSKEIFEWKSSKVERVKYSGYLFWKGFSEALGIPLVKSEPTKYDEDADHYFRVYNYHKGYLEEVKKLKESSIFLEKSYQENNFLNKVHQKIGINTKNLSSSNKLLNMSYFKEILDSEMYFENKKFLNNILTEEEIIHIHELAQWVWEKRFFMPGFGEILGGKLLREIMKDCDNDNIKFCIYSAHDYTILSLLAALGNDKYIGGCLGFGSFLLFEIYKNLKNEKIIKILLNSHTFEEKIGKPSYYVQYKPIEIHSFSNF
jgi:hypothetical protein